MVLDSIRLNQLEVSCIVGVYPSERLIPQPLILDLELFIDTRPAAQGGGLKASIDYAKLCGELEFLLKSCRFLLLEEAAEAICRYLLAPTLTSIPRARIDSVSLALSKPEALKGRATPSVVVHRKRGEYSFEEEVKTFGLVDIIYETKGCGIYRLRVGPGKNIPTHLHQTMEEHEMMLTDGLRLQGQEVKAGTAFSWPQAHPHLYENVSSVEQVILCVDRPCFVAEDEIEVGTPYEELELIGGEQYYPCQEEN